MKLSELIEQLEKIRMKHGDIPVITQTLTHTWAPEPEVRETRGSSKSKFVLLNP